MFDLSEAFKKWAQNFEVGDKVRAKKGEHTGDIGSVIKKIRTSNYKVKFSDDKAASLHHVNDLEPHSNDDKPETPAPTKRKSFADMFK
jgi:hypothetical protein